MIRPRRVLEARRRGSLRFQLSNEFNADILPVSSLSAATLRPCIVVVSCLSELSPVRNDAASDNFKQAIYHVHVGNFTKPNLYLSSRASLSSTDFVACLARNAATPINSSAASAAATAQAVLNRNLGPACSFFALRFRPYRCLHCG